MESGWSAFAYQLIASVYPQNPSRSETGISISRSGMPCGFPMELLGHDFFLFTDADTDRLNLLYRRKDGNYGLIEAQRG